MSFYSIPKAFIFNRQLNRQLERNEQKHECVATISVDKVRISYIFWAAWLNTRSQISRANGSIWTAHTAEKQAATDA